MDSKPTFSEFICFNLLQRYQTKSWLGKETIELGTVMSGQAVLMRLGASLAARFRSNPDAFVQTFVPSKVSPAEILVALSHDAENLMLPFVGSCDSYLELVLAMYRANGFEYDIRKSGMKMPSAEAYKLFLAKANQGVGFYHASPSAFHELEIRSNGAIGKVMNSLGETGDHDFVTTCTNDFFDFTNKLYPEEYSLLQRAR